MAADALLAKIQSWKDEDSHRGRLVRAFNDNYLNDAKLQAKRLAFLAMYAEREPSFA